MSSEREPGRFKKVITAIEIVGGVAVAGGVIYGATQIIPRLNEFAINLIQQYPDVCCASTAIVIGIGFGALMSTKSSNPNPQRVDMTNFSGGHIQHSVDVAPLVDDPPEENKD